MKTYRFILFVFTLFNLVACETNVIRESGNIRYKVETTTGESSKIRIRVYNLNDFPWFVSTGALATGTIIHDVLVDSEPVGLDGVMEFPNTAGQYRSVEAGGHLEGTVDVWCWSEGANAKLKEEDAIFVWSSVMSVHEKNPRLQVKPRIIELQGKVALTACNTKYGNTKN